MSDEGLKVPLVDYTGPLDPRPDPSEIEPLEPVLPPEGVTAAKIADVARAVEAAGRSKVDVAGVRGGAAALVVGALARTSRRRLVLVASDFDAARRLADDVGFVLRAARDGEADGEETGEGDVLVFPASESSPFADVNPDRRAAMTRMAVLSHLASD